MVGIARLGEYYRSRYYVAPGKTLTLNIDEIPRFLSDEDYQKAKMTGKSSKKKVEVERV